MKDKKSQKEWSFGKNSLVSVTIKNLSFSVFSSFLCMLFYEKQPRSFPGGSKKFFSLLDPSLSTKLEQNFHDNLSSDLSWKILLLLSWQFLYFLVKKVHYLHLWKFDCLLDENHITFWSHPLTLLITTEGAPDRLWLYISRTVEAILLFRQ